MKMYPKVKVRQQQDQDDHQHVFPDFSSTDEHEDTFVPSIAKVPKSYMLNIAVSFTNDTPEVAMPKISVIKEEEKDNKKVDYEDGKQNIRACSVPRPRAVLSSPDLKVKRQVDTNDKVQRKYNDLAIGNRNRSKTERLSVLKTSKLPQNRHSQCKVVPNTSENSVNTKKSKESHDDSNLKGRKGPVITSPTQKRQSRTEKPATTRT